MKTTEKSVLRQEALRHRARMDLNAEDAEAACQRFFETVTCGPGDILGLYWPLPREFDIHPLIERALGQDISCVLPIVEKQSLVMKFARWNESVPLQKGLCGNMEPQSKDWAEPNIILVPFLAFDRRGYRLGHGGGYYDATLQELRARKPVVAVGIGYAQQACIFNLPVEEHDQRLDWVITPKDAHYFGD